MQTISTQNSIAKVLITGGTHGNEMSGIQAIEYWQKNKSKLHSIAPSTNIELCLVNQAAINAKTRYIDEDLNRQFSHDLLNQKLSTSSSHEAKLANKFNQEYGPKGASLIDFNIDIHNTTSNMGATLIILVNDNFNQQLARYVKDKMPNSVILVEDYQDFEKFGYLCSVAKKGVMIEVGPQLQGTLRADIYKQTIEMTYIILAFIEHYNNGQHQTLPPVEAFRLDSEVAYPTNGSNEKTAMIHNELDGKDFEALQPGQACFIDFDGKTISWEGKQTYPHFIGEAAYDHLNLAFASADKCLF
jgi:aspartoacylase